jgi:hypothetical protein
MTAKPYPDTITWRGVTLEQDPPSLLTVYEGATDGPIEFLSRATAIRDGWVGHIRIDGTSIGRGLGDTPQAALDAALDDAISKARERLEALEEVRRTT